MNPPPTNKPVPPKHDRKSTPPEMPGIYDFSCMENDFSAETIHVVYNDGELWATIGGEYRPLKMWHEGLTDCAYRSPLDCNQMRSDIVPLLALLRAFGNNNIVDKFVAKYPILK